jgi:hypothetical protein
MLPQAEKRKASRPSSGFLKEHETPSDHILESAFNHPNQKVFSRLQITKAGAPASVTFAGIARQSPGRKLVTKF